MSSVDWQKELQAFEAWATAMHFSIGAYVPQGDCFAAKFLADETQGAWCAWKFRVLEQVMAYDYAVSLATNLRRKHFPAQEDWELLPDTLGVLTQIDNMVSDVAKDAARYRWLRDEDRTVHAFLVAAVKDKSMTLEHMDNAIDAAMAQATK